VLRKRTSGAAIRRPTGVCRGTGDQSRRWAILRNAPPPCMGRHDLLPPVRCRRAGPFRGDVSSATGRRNLFLRKQLALYQERCGKPRRADPAPRAILVLLSHLLDWRSLLNVVQPDTLIRWHRQGWRRLWRWKSRPGRPPIPRGLQRLIVTMAQANPTWGEERIADELRLKLGVSVSPRTVGRYLRTPAVPSRRRATFAAVGDLCAEPCARGRGV
jgi:Homeodomain-like domain